MDEKVKNRISFISYLYEWCFDELRMLLFNFKYTKDWFKIWNDFYFMAPLLLMIFVDKLLKGRGEMVSHMHIRWYDESIQ